MAVWLVADFEALSYQVTTTFDTSYTARIRTAPAINYTACWQLVFIHIHLFVIYLAFIFLSFSICTNLSTKHKFILFFWGWAIQKPTWKAVTWAGKAKALLRAFGLSVGSCGLANVLTTMRWLYVSNNPILRDLPVNGWVLLYKISIVAYISPLMPEICRCDVVQLNGAFHERLYIPSNAMVF